jgi:hypothetical protein
MSAVMAAAVMAARQVFHAQQQTGQQIAAVAVVAAY